MDIEKLIEQLNGYFEGKDLKRGVALDAATALSALQAENEKLRAELEQMAACVYYKQGGLCRYGEEDPANVCVFGPCPYQRSAQEVLAELEQVKRERAAAVEGLHKLCSAWKWDGQKGGLTLKYKVSFSGFAYVEADFPEEAEEKAMYEDDAVYEEKKCESVEEVDEFAVSLGSRMVVDWAVIRRLGLSFPGWFINAQGEFIAHQKANVYFNISTCESELDVKCKVLEWFSRPACKSTPFRRAVDNTALHIFFLNGINQYLDTRFSVEDMREIYTYLGNACNHQKTIRFIESGYDMAVLEDKE